LAKDPRMSSHLNRAQSPRSNLTRDSIPAKFRQERKLPGIGIRRNPTARAPSNRILGTEDGDIDGGGRSGASRDSMGSFERFGFSNQCRNSRYCDEPQAATPLAIA
jgi:hypothetical protein